MDMSIHEGTIWQRMTSNKGRTAISHFFVMDWVSIWIDIGAGLLIAGALAALVPNQFWQAFFLQGHPTLAKLWGPAVGPIVAILSFVCSVGNVPLAAVLWNGGISFGGVVAFLFADLIVLPILNIYLKYYGMKISALLLVVSYISMALAALAMEFLFGSLHLVPQERKAQIVEEAIRWNYTTILNIIFLVLAMFRIVRFLRTAGPAMLRMMSGAPATINLIMPNVPFTITVMLSGRRSLHRALVCIPSMMGMGTTANAAAESTQWIWKSALMPSPAMVNAAR
jgi:hypothetical protein